MQNNIQLYLIISQSKEATANVLSPPGCWATWSTWEASEGQVQLSSEAPVNETLIFHVLENPVPFLVTYVRNCAILGLVESFHFFFSKLPLTFCVICNKIGSAKSYHVLFNNHEQKQAFGRSRAKHNFLSELFRFFSSSPH